MMRGLPEYCIYTSISSHVRGCSHDFLLQDPSGLERSKGRTTHGGRPGSASSTSRTTRETSSSRSSLSLRRLAPALQSLPPFFPHRTQTHCRESPRCYMASTLGITMAACADQVGPVKIPFFLASTTIVDAILFC